MRLSGWLTKSSSSRTGNSYCHIKAGMIMFTWLPLSTRALTFLSSMVSSTNVSGLIQCDMGPPTSNSGSQIHQMTWTFTSDWVFIAPGVGWLFSPTPLAFICSQCHLLKALWCRQSLAKWPGDPHMKHFLSLVAGHHLSKAHIEAFHSFQLRLRILP